MKRTSLDKAFLMSSELRVHSALIRKESFPESRMHILKVYPTMEMMLQAGEAR